MTAIVFFLAFEKKKRFKTNELLIFYDVIWKLKVYIFSYFVKLYIGLICFFSIKIICKFSLLNLENLSHVLFSPRNFLFEKYYQKFTKYKAVKKLSPILPIRIQSFQSFICSKVFFMQFIGICFIYWSLWKSKSQKSDILFLKTASIKTKDVEKLNFDDKSASNPCKLFFSKMSQPTLSFLFFILQYLTGCPTNRDTFKINFSFQAVIFLSDHKKLNFIIGGVIQTTGFLNRFSFVFFFRRD